MDTVDATRTGPAPVPTVGPSGQPDQGSRRRRKDAPAPLGTPDLPWHGWVVRPTRDLAWRRRVMPSFWIRVCGVGAEDDTGLIAVPAALVGLAGVAIGLVEWALSVAVWPVVALLRALGLIDHRIDLLTREGARWYHGTVRRMTVTIRGRKARAALVQSLQNSCRSGVLPDRRAFDRIVTLSGATVTWRSSALRWALEHDGRTAAAPRRGPLPG